MTTVALIGADGAGKTTIGRRLAEEQPELIKYVYMGINVDASNLALPTTRLLFKTRRALGKQQDMGGPPDPTRTKPRPKGKGRRAAAGLKSTLRLVNRLAEEWFRQIMAWYYQRQGYVVLFDRHFYSDYYAHDIANRKPGRPLANRIHGFVLEYFYPKPNLVILLDAPVDVLYARKGEGTPALLELRRQEYLQMREKVKHFKIVDASQSQDDVTRAVVELVRDYDRARSAGRSGGYDARG